MNSIYIFGKKRTLKVIRRGSDYLLFASGSRDSITLSRDSLERLVRAQYGLSGRSFKPVRR